MRCVVGMVIAFRLEEEVPELPRRHGEQPSDHHRDGRLYEYQNVGEDEADRAYKMQRLIDPIVMVVPVIVPTLLLECFGKCHRLLRAQGTKTQRRYDYEKRECDAPCVRFFIGVKLL